MKNSILLTYFLLVGLTVSPTFAQPAEDPRQIMSEAFGKFLNRDEAEGLAIMRDVAQRYRGTEAGREALLFLAANDGSQTIAYLQQIATDFPDTIYETNARLELLRCDFARTGDKAAYVQGCSQLALQMGGPSMEEILSSGNSPAIAAQIRALGADRQRRLLNVYATMHFVVGESFVDAEPGDPATKRQIVYFLHRTFSPLGIGYDGMVPLFDTLPVEIFNLVSSTKTTFIDPTISFISPASGTATGPLPMIKARITVGDFTVPEASLDALQARLDGTDVKGSIDFQVTIGDPQPGVVFATTDLTFQPSAPLAQGPHQFTLEVPVQGYSGTGPGKTVATLNFSVASSTTDQTLNVSKDSILSQQNPHRNEGANNLLQLSHRPEEKNKSNNPIIAFDLSNVNLTGLRKARLVLNIQECEQPKKWGPEGRNILAYPVNQEWVEGNGETIKTGQEEKTRGSGRGVTWFSPIDENIANKAPNGALQWNGARPFLGPLTAAPVLIVNKQVGTIEFDVTQDVKSGFSDGWLFRKQDEAAFGNVRFYSKEGNPALAPKLILEYNGPTAQAPSRSLLSIVLQLVEQGYRQLQADRGTPGSELSWLGRWWPAWLQA